MDELMECPYCRMPYDSEGDANCTCYMVEDIYYPNEEG